MSLDGLIAPEAVVADLSATSKKLLLQELAQRASTLWGTNNRVVFEALLDRERLGATSVGNGVAIPHARLPELDGVRTMFAKLKKPVDYDATDDAPVDLVFMLLAPETANADHLKALAKISRLMKRPDVRDSLRGAESADAMHLMLIEPRARAA